MHKKDKIVDLYKSGMSVKAIAHDISVSSQYVYHVLRAYKHALSSVDAQEVRTLREKGYTQKQIASLLRVGIDAVRTVLKQTAIDTQTSNITDKYTDIKKERERTLLILSFAGKVQDALLAKISQTSWQYIYLLRKKYNIPHVVRKLKKTSDEYKKLSELLRKRFAPVLDSLPKNMNKRECKQCGTSFVGGPRAFYCHACRQKRKAESYARYVQNVKAGSVREIGREAQCLICGKAFVIRGGTHFYCDDCAPCVYKENELAGNKRYYDKNKEMLSITESLEKRRGAKFCEICGKPFDNLLNARICGDPACVAERRRRAKRAAYHRHKEAKLGESDVQAHTEDIG